MQLQDAHTPGRRSKGYTYAQKGLLDQAQQQKWIEVDAEIRHVQQARIYSQQCINESWSVHVCLQVKETQKRVYPVCHIDMHNYVLPVCITLFS